MKIIYFQVKVFSQALAKIDVFTAIFPTNKLDYSIGRARIVVSEKKEESSDNLGSNDEIWQEDNDEGDGILTREVEVSQILSATITLR